MNTFKNESTITGIDICVDTTGSKITTHCNTINKVTYAGSEYAISRQLCGKIGFLAGMLDAGLFDDLELPLPSDPQTAAMGHNVLLYMSSNPNSGINYLHGVILGGRSNKEYVDLIRNNNQQQQKLELLQIRANLAQVFALLSLADYWDCNTMTQDCAEFLAHHLSAADPQLVRDWFGGII